MVTLYLIGDALHSRGGTGNHVSTLARQHIITESFVVVGGCACLLIVVLVYWEIYWLNQIAVRKERIPRQEKLESLLASLK